MTGDDREIKTKSRQQEKQAVLSFGKKKKIISFFLLLTVLFLFWNKVELQAGLGKVVIRDGYSSTLSEFGK